VRHRLLFSLIFASLLLAPACGSKGEPIRETGHHTVTAAEGKPSFVLKDTQGNTFDFLKQTEGYVTILYFGYRNCPDLCPTEMSTLAGALRGLPPDLVAKVRVVFVTVDPARDTPVGIRQWLDLFDSRFIGLWGSEREIDVAGRAAFGDDWGPIVKRDWGEGRYSVSHPAVVLAYDINGNGPAVYHPGTDISTWQNEIRRMVEGS
jgi:protein SCO1/2